MNIARPSILQLDQQTAMIALSREPSYPMLYRKIVLGLLCFTAFMPILVSDAVGQSSDPLVSGPLQRNSTTVETRKAIPATLGFGAIGISDEFPLGYGGILTYQVNHDMFSFRAEGGSGTQANLLPHESAYDVSVLYGYGIYPAHSLLRMSASLGLGWAWGGRRVLDHTEPGPIVPTEFFRLEKYSAIGLAYSLQAFTKFSDSSRIGIGITYGGMINKSRSMREILLCFVFGTD